MGLFPTISKLPKAPLTPVFVTFMRCKKKPSVIQKGSFPVGTDGWIKFPKEGEMIVLLPYLDLPIVALKEENAIGFLTMQGDRGWMNKDDAKDYFENVHHDHHQAVQMRSLFHSAGWEAIPVTWICIDWEKHFRVRGDDQDFDVTCDAFWKQSRLIHCCEWCGHANLHTDWVKNPTCEACGWTEEEESKHDKKRREYVKRPMIEFDEDQDINLGEEWL